MALSSGVLPADNAVPFFQIGEILKGGNQLPFSQKIGVIPITDDALRFLQKLLIFRKSGIGKKRVAKPKKG